MILWRELMDRFDGKIISANNQVRTLQFPGYSKAIEFVRNANSRGMNAGEPIVRRFGVEVHIRLPNKMYLDD